MKEIRRIFIKARSDRREKNKAYAAKDSELNSENNAVNSNEETTEAKLNCESPLSQWITNTGATAHIINQLHLFRGSLKEVKKKSVQVKGNARLRIKGAGQVQVQTKEGVINLLNVLYIPNLGVNLLSGAILCNLSL
jgi:hypothetical protein